MGKQVKTPRFYVDIPTFLHATGQLGWDGNNGGAELLYMNCANPYTKQVDTTGTEEVAQIGHGTNNTAKTSFPVNFCALLNHNYGSNTNKLRLFGKSPTTSTFNTSQNILNSDYVGTRIKPQYNGTSIFTFSDKNGINDTWQSFSIYYATDNPITTDDLGIQQLGSLVVGKYFDCPRTPDLNLTMSRRFDGIKKQKTIGGKQLANIYYDGPTEWTMNRRTNDFGGDSTYKYPPFELDTTATVDSQGFRFDYRSRSGLGRKGLRSWDLTFSYIAESDMWIDSEVSNLVINDDIDDAPYGGGSPTGGYGGNPMLSDNSFNFVYNCTLGGALPFIFTDDKDSNAPDRYAICTFRENTFKVTQVAFNTYNVSMTIDEIA
jgi:hypothetical protein|tara:strand:+ start:826 stop:1950 length:1125 start_codon:yes stop_codon:yes gene_type:complete